MTLLLGAGFLSQPPPPSYRVEVQPVADGAELITVFGRLHNPASGFQDLDVPLLTVLRDSLGDSDPANARLRDVWILTSTRPTPWQRAASALSFGFFRAGSKSHANRVPSPALDLASPYKSVYSDLFSDGLQALEFDPLGAAIRSTTRTYRGNSSDYSKLQVFQALATLDNIERDPDSLSVLPDSQFREIYSRLSLSTHAFGGLVREQHLSKYYDKQTSQLQQTRGHNWDLLRQRAELNGLIFEPLAIASGTPSEALLWIARSDLDGRAERRFDGQFLSIANPWTDDRLMHWTGYTQTTLFRFRQSPCAARNTRRARRRDDSARALQPGLSARSAAARRFSRQFEAQAPRDGQPRRHQHGDWRLGPHALWQSGVLRRRGGLDFRARASRRRGESQRASAGLFGSPRVPVGGFQPRSRRSRSSCSAAWITWRSIRARTMSRTKPIWRANNTPRCSSTPSPRAARRSSNATGAKSWKPTRNRLAGALSWAWDASSLVDRMSIPRSQTQSCTPSSMHIAAPTTTCAFSIRSWHPVRAPMWCGTPMPSAGPCRLLAPMPTPAPKAQHLISQVCARSTDGDLRSTCLRAPATMNAAVRSRSRSPPQPVATLGQ